MPKAGSNHNCLVVINVHSAHEKDENYYLRAFLKECKKIEKKVIRHILKLYRLFLATLMKNRMKVNIIIVFERAIFKNIVLREQFSKRSFWGSSFERAILKMFF